MILPFRILAVGSVLAAPVLWTAAAGAQGQGEAGATDAAPIVPLARPEPGSMPNPASQRIRTNGGLTLPVPYAPPISGFEAIKAGESELILEARLADNTPPLTHGVTWRVFAAEPNADGTLPLVATSMGGTSSFRLPMEIRGSSKKYQRHLW